MIILAFISGIVLWTFLEYILHRFLGHVHKGKNFFKAEHSQHHAKFNYFAPAYKKTFAGLVVMALLFLVIQMFLSASITLAFLIGLMGMYLLYEVTHYRFHIRKPVAKPFILLRKHHFYHHFHNPRVNHGVTSRFWDRIFGTFMAAEKVRIPRNMAMRWLLKDEEVKPDYKPHFHLVGKS
jgi:sterol desaturase/sphingolipid hydroxylase (fatty acid hydroxylase superfamily)